MRRLLVLAMTCAASAAGLLVGAVPAMADAGPHHASTGIVTDTCAGCHRLHTAKGPHLLKQSQSSLCYSCHGSGAPGSSEDVVNGVGYGSGPAAALRGGGFQYTLIDSGNPSGSGSSGVIPTRSPGSGQPVTSTHSVSGTPQTAWGFGEVDGSVNYGKTISLSCGNCHDPHGNGNYRILRTTPKETIEHGEAMPAWGEVAIPDTSTKDYTTSNYWAAYDATTAGFMENIASWCTICHTRYLADHEGHTDSGDPVYTYRHTSDQNTQGAGKRNCIQCHVAHGSSAHMGERSSSVAFPDASGALGPGEEGGDSRLLRIDSRGVCKMCHGDK